MFSAKPSRIAAAVAFAIGLTATASAQETTSSIRGVVTSEATGQTISNATVTLTDNRTGTSRTFAANENGLFSARGLAVGGPYTVVVTDAMGNSRTVENVFLTLGETENVAVSIQQANVERISVTGQVLNMTSGATGPSATFSLTDLQDAPTVNRDIKDLIRTDPRIYINESNARDIQCGGANPRFNSLTVDGVRTNDNFGLNSSGYPTERMPFSYDAIEQVSVELAPFNVQYGGFTACNINAVTKSGENELFGGVFFDYTNDSLQGDKLEGQSITVAPYNERRYGFNVGGAIIKDKLFFFGAYEKLEGVNTFARGPADSDAATKVMGVTQAQLDEIGDIARTVYGFDPGGFPSSLPVEDEKFLAKLDWYISDDHRASFTYNYNDGFSVAESDRFAGAIEFSGHYYERGSKFTSYIAQVYSDWTSNFSTEVRVGYSELDARVNPLGGTEVGEIQIRLPGATVFLGADDSRHSNKLYYDTTFMKLAGSYLYGDHTFTFGYEREAYDVFNLFIQETEGEVYFNTIQDFRDGRPSTFIYENAAGTNNPNDGAAAFKYAVNTAFLQDEYYFIEHDLTLTYGLRYDWYETDDRPALNSNFLNQYGFPNTATVDGMGLLQPRVGFNWRASDQLEMRGGFGLYSGGNPNVWLSNNYSNNGTTLFETRLVAADFANQTLFDIAHNGSGRPLYDIPQVLVDRVANAQGIGPVNALDPNFKLPKEWKYALGATYTFDNGYVLMADALFTDKENAARISDMRRGPNGTSPQSGTAPDGRPIYPNASGPEAFLLTNVDGNSGKQTSVSLALAKRHDWGLNWTLAYAYNDAEDVNPMTSSVAYSNYNNIAYSDIENPGVARSNYEIPHRFTFRATYKTEMFSGLDSKFSVFASANKGRPFSYTMSGGAFGDTNGNRRQLLYVPTGLTDPNVVFGPNFDTTTFFNFINDSGLNKYAGGIAPRNEFNSDWWHKVDFKFDQQLPAFADGHRSSVYFVIDNLTNLLNDDWGVLYEAPFPRAIPVADVSINANNQYVFTGLRPEVLNGTVQNRVGGPSLWSIRLGFKYDF